jgi:DNA-binding PadR family transcriptional regulator
MSLPQITHLQYLVLNILLDGDKTGREVRERLAAHGERKSGPAFYQFMARLEDARLMEGQYSQLVIGGKPYTERRYKITALGVSAWEDVRDFYLTHAGRPLQRA